MDFTLHLGDDLDLHLANDLAFVLCIHLYQFILI